jgi:MSHA pilin protein MshC
MNGYQKKTATGFTLVELLAVLTLTAILSGVAVSRSFSSSAFELQGSRAQLFSAFRAAQQLAMVQTDVIRFSTAGDQLNIFRSGVALSSLNGMSLPISLSQNQSVSSASFDFDRLGRTRAANILLSQDGVAVSITVTGAGHIE